MHRGLHRSARALPSLTVPPPPARALSIYLFIAGPGQSSARGDVQGGNAGWGARRGQLDPPTLGPGGRGVRAQLQHFVNTVHGACI